MPAFASRGAALLTVSSGRTVLIPVLTSALGHLLSFSMCSLLPFDLRFVDEDLRIFIDGESLYQYIDLDIPDRGHLQQLGLNEIVEVVHIPGVHLEHEVVVPEGFVNVTDLLLVLEIVQYDGHGHPHYLDRNEGLHHPYLPVIYVETITPDHPFFLQPCHPAADCGLGYPLVLAHGAHRLPGVGFHRFQYLDVPVIKNICHGTALHMEGFDIKNVT
ncbi:hypothetical protein SDC9_149747 [bioreactor metagenome]|uniref:Uncharacterized protein n=1 Tax=bioreactor metagenome TaxID=1076179 RepID=A0A645EKM3_9ZZZZ